MNILPAEYHRKHFTPSYHIAGVNGSYIRSLCGREWDAKEDDCQPSTERVKPQCSRCYAVWNRRTHYGEHHPAFGLPGQGNAMIHAIKVRRIGI